MKQNPTKSIKARYRVGLRAKNHIKITSDNLMLSEVIVFHPIKYIRDILFISMFTDIIRHFIEIKQYVI